MRRNLIKALYEIGVARANCEISREERVSLDVALHQVMTHDEILEASKQLCALHKYADEQEEYARVNP